MTAGMPSVHRAAARGFASNASDYERARPGYPADAMSHLEERLGLRPGRVAVDVGAGTGKLTRLVARTGATTIAVEPVEAMREQLAAAVPEALACAATAGSLPLATASADAVVCAQAFHWFATVEVLDEFARVLRPGRCLVLLWNLRDRSVPWVREFTALLAPYEGDRPDHNTGEWRQPFREGGPFGPLETGSFSIEQRMTPELLVSRAASMSFIGALDDATRADVLERVRRLGEEQGPEFALPYRTDVHITVRR